MKSHSFAVDALLLLFSFTSHVLLQACTWKFQYDDLGEKEVEYFLLIHIICHSVISFVHQQTFVLFFSGLQFAVRLPE